MQLNWGKKKKRAVKRLSTVTRRKSRSRNEREAKDPCWRVAAAAANNQGVDGGLVKSQCEMVMVMREREKEREIRLDSVVTRFN